MQTSHEHLPGFGVPDVPRCHGDDQPAQVTEQLQAIMTWIEQQGKTSEELNAQWYDPTYWTSLHGMDAEIDKLIERFNERVGLLGK